MGKRVLVAYGSRAGSTAEVAQFIGEQLCAAGLAAEVRPAKEVRDVAGYAAVVMGSGVRMGRLYGDVMRLAKKQRAALAALPVAYFTVCMSLKENTPENVALAEGYLAPLREIKAPVSQGLFAGRVDPNTMEPLFRFMMSRGGMETGDWRDWEAIRAWSGELAANI